MIKHIWFTPAVLNALGDTQQVLTTCNNCLGQYLQNETNKNGSVDQKSNKFFEDIQAIMRSAISSYNPNLGRCIGIVFQKNGDHLDIVVRFNFYTEQPTEYMH